MYSKAPRDRGKIDVGVGKRRPDMRVYRLAFHLGVALRHADGNLFMRTGKDFGLGVLAVIDKGLMDAAERRGAVHRQIVKIERL